MNDDGWARGVTKIAVFVACCPDCGSVDIQHKGRRTPESILVYWRCTDCGRYWKGSDAKISRAIIVN